MADGIATPDIPVGQLTHILGNGDADGIQDTVVESVSDFLARAAIVGPIADRINDAAEEGKVFTSEEDLEAYVEPGPNTPATIRGSGSSLIDGHYMKTGAENEPGWVRISGLSDGVSSSDLAAALSLATTPVIVNFSAPLIWDWQDVRGGGVALYVPRAVTVTRGEMTLIDTTTLGAESVEIPGYLKSPLPSGALTTPRIWRIDTTDAGSPVKISTYPDGADLGLSGDKAIIFAASLRGYASGHRVEVLDGLAAQPVYLNEGIVVDGSKILVPGGVHFRADQGFQTFGPLDGSRFFEFDAPSANTAGRIYLDDFALDAGQAAVKLATAGANPDAGGWRMPLIAKVYGGLVSTEHAVYPLLPNTSGVRKNNPEDATLRYGSTVDTNISVAELVALGFTRGVLDLTAGRPFYGARFRDRTPGTFIHMRVYMQTDVDNDFPLVRMYWVQDSGVGTTAAIATLEKKISARVAMFSVRVPIPFDNPNIIGAWIGCLAFDPTIRTIRLCGLQIAEGARGPGFISRDDYPDAVGSNGFVSAGDVARAVKIAGASAEGGVPIYGDEMFLIQSRPQELYVNGLYKVRTDGQDIRLSLQAKALVGGVLPAPAVAPGSIGLMGGSAAVAAEIVTTTLTATASGKRTVRPVTIRSAPRNKLSGKKPKLLALGDSLTEYTGFPQAAQRELQACGADVEFIGTVDIREVDQITGSTNLRKGEGRGSRDFRSYTGQDGDVGAVPCKPFPDSFIPDYLALSTGDKRDWNPFLRPAVGGDPSDMVFTIAGQSYIFDLRFYLTRFGLPDPEFLSLNLGTNDIAHGGLPAKSALVAKAISIIVGRSRLAVPTLHVGLILNPLARSVEGDARWPQQVLLANEMMAYVNSKKTEVDANGRKYVAFLQCAAHANNAVGFDATTDATDALTGVVSATVTDPLHYSGTTKEQVGRQIAAWIACRATGA